MIPIIIGESVRGESHIRRGVECQDSFLVIDGIHRHNRKGKFYDEMPDDARIIAVADGHGSESCPYSKTGSQTASNVFCDIMSEYAAKFKESRDELFVSLNREGETARLSKCIVNEWARRILKFHAMEKRVVIKNKSGEDDIEAILKLYGTTLLGMLIMKDFIFVLQLGDGDITYVDSNEVSPVIIGDKILGVETHSISKPSSWKKVLTRVISLENSIEEPFMYILSTDGWINSHLSEEEFYKTCREYYKMISEQGTEVVENNLERWLSETSAMGCGDDITAVFVYYKQGC